MANQITQHIRTACQPWAMRKMRRYSVKDYLGTKKGGADTRAPPIPFEGRDELGAIQRLQSFG